MISYASQPQNSRTAFGHTRSTHLGNNSNLASMAKAAYHDALSAQPAGSVALSSEQAGVVINSLHGALERAAHNPAFNRLPRTEQSDAARQLAEQFIEGQRLVNALQGAMNNPCTMATQLVNNASSPAPSNVLERIVDLNRPRTAIRSAQVQLMGAMPIGAIRQNVSAQPAMAM